MYNPLVSIIIPVYNVEKFVEQAILSICYQTYSNLEIIIVDDCSSDATYEIIKKLQKLDARIKIFRNENNSKIVKTLNFALQQARGDFIARMDGDDISTFDRIEKQLNFLLNNFEYQLVGSHIITIDEDGNKIGSQRMPTSQTIINKTIKFNSPVSHIWLARKDVYNILNGYRDISGVEDYDFLLRMHSQNLLFTNLDSFDYYVRLRNGNTASTIGFEQRLMANYVVELYGLRKAGKPDNFNESKMKDYISLNQKFKPDFLKSNEYLSCALKTKSEKRYLKMFFYLFLSSINSKFQFQYLYKRFIFKLISKF